MDEQAHSGWSRQEITVRLGRTRLAKLKSIAASMAPGAAPTEAIDHAIELARFGHADYSGHLVQIAEAIDAMAERDRVDGARIEARLRELAQAVDGLRALISDVAGEE